MFHIFSYLTCCYRSSSLIVSCSLPGKLVPFLENVVAGASVFTILFICVERHKAICQPLRRSSEAVCRVVKPICIIWTLCAFISFPFVFFPVFRKSLWVDGTPINVCRHPIRYPWQKAYLVAVPVVFFVLPLSILIALYCMVGKVLVPNSQSNTCHMMEESYQLKMKQRRQGLNTVVLIVLIFFASHLPYRVISLWLIFESREVLSQLGLEAYLGILYFARVAFYLNHAFNPILYNFVSRKFRLELKRMCCKYQCCVGRDYFLDDDSLAQSRTKGKLPRSPSRKISAHLNDIPVEKRANSCKVVMINREEKCEDMVSPALPPRSDRSSRKKKGAFEWIMPRSRPSQRAEGECYSGKLASLIVFLRPTRAGFEIDVDLCKDSSNCTEKQIQI